MYSGDSISYDILSKSMTITGSGTIKYQDMTLNADTIEYDTENRFITANGNGVLKDGNETIYCEKLEYNISSGKGRLKNATSSGKKELYNGSVIARLKNKSLLIENGDYTTCGSKDLTHYFFYGHKMKLLPGDKILAKPMILNIAETPVAVIPYFIAPASKGRQSGWLRPHWGESFSGGNARGYIDNVGYYFATNDYMDHMVKFDMSNGDGFFFRDYTVNAQMRYHLKDWVPTGRISYTRSVIKNTGYSAREDWGLNFTHRNFLTPDHTFSIYGSGRMTGSRTFYQETSPDRDDYLRENINSDLELRKTWPKLNANAYIKAHQDRDLEEDITNESLPLFGFNFNNRLLIDTSSKEPYRFGDPKVTGDTSGTFPADEWSPKDFIYNIYYGYKMQGVNKNRSAPDDDRRPGFKGRKAIGHDLNVSVPQDFLKYFKLTPSFSYHEGWFDRKILPDTIIEVGIDSNENYFRDTTITQDTIGLEGENFFYRRHTWQTGFSLSTKLFGTFAPEGAGRFGGLRHELRPTLGFTYSPEWENGQYFDPLGVATASTRNSPLRKSCDIGFSHLFQTKIKENPENEKSKERKINLLNLRQNTHYNFAADSARWADLSSSGGTRIAMFSTSFSTLHDIVEKKNGSTPSLLKLINYSLSVSTSLRINGKISSGDISADSVFPYYPELPEMPDDSLNRPGTNPLYENDFDELSGFSEIERDTDPDAEKAARNGMLPWSFSSGFSYRYRADLDEEFN
ncbi:MAG: putative LPS assembly protein LptD, partial [Fibrobacterota bacterium]